MYGKKFQYRIMLLSIYKKNFVQNNLNEAIKLKNYEKNLVF